MHGLNGEWRLGDHWLRPFLRLILVILLEVFDIVNELITLFLPDYLDDLLKLVKIGLLPKVLYGLDVHAL